ncbi:MAG: outer membrane lipoprotein carrier protein LolA [Bacteroidota bacterium]|nr:outer membrane lipoprotein carrier protein LolA [Bacteroidota bacterium]MDX5428640.1 outer membrane lipoprotein carrier protein LolA [Bacteroidota bacterium]MDX5447123.1 outer membrane lipoprotein carrier protein LolA [Bacteroidota bacterium]MDX5506377.1 outer membrane lipoprotein carrier protein LolA [Bacteroidota bacterium]
MMKKLLTLLLSLTMVIGFAQSHVEAKKLLDQVKKTTQGYKNQKLTFTQTIEIPNPNGGFRSMKKEGVIFLDKDEYRIELEGMVILRTKNKMYTIVPEDKEVTVLPINEENKDRVLSPSSLLKEFESGYSYKMAGSENVNGKKIQYILLKPTASEEIREILIGIDTKTNQLVSFKQTGLNNVVTTFAVTNYQVDLDLPKSTFNFKKKDYPGYTIIE